MARSQSMSFDSSGGIAGDRRADTIQFLRGSCFIHQCASVRAHFRAGSDSRDRRRHVDDAFQGIGVESPAAGNKIGGELDGQHHKADPQAAERNPQRFIHYKILATGAVR